jgi:hypothetical protein
VTAPSEWPRRNSTSGGVSDEAKRPSILVFTCLAGHLVRHHDFDNRVALRQKSALSICSGELHRKKAARNAHVFFDPNQ